jgi:hypothetical protein
VLEVLSTSGDTHLDGDDFDKVYSSSSIILGKLPHIPISYVIKTGLLVRARSNRYVRGKRKPPILRKKNPTPRLRTI